MERRKTAVLIGGKIYSFYTDDPEEYIETLEQRANEALREGERAAGGSSGGAVLAIISLTDRLMRMEEKHPEKTDKPKNAAPRKKDTQTEAQGQMTVWDVLEMSGETADAKEPDAPAIPEGGEDEDAVRAAAGPAIPEAGRDAAAANEQDEPAIPEGGEDAAAPKETGGPAGHQKRRKRSRHEKIKRGKA